MSSTTLSSAMSTPQPAAVTFKLSLRPDGPTRLAAFTQRPGWVDLAARVAAIFDHPAHGSNGGIALAYTDAEGDEITLDSEPELALFYAERDAAGDQDEKAIKFVVLAHGTSGPPPPPHERRRGHGHRGHGRHHGPPPLPPPPPPPHHGPVPPPPPPHDGPGGLPGPPPPPPPPPPPHGGPEHYFQAHWDEDNEGPSTDEEQGGNADAFGPNHFPFGHGGRRHRGPGRGRGHHHGPHHGPGRGTGPWAGHGPWSHHPHGPFEHGHFPGPWGFPHQHGPFGPDGPFGHGHWPFGRRGGAGRGGRGGWGWGRNWGNGSRRARNAEYEGGEQEDEDMYYGQ